MANLTRIGPLRRKGPPILALQAPPPEQPPTAVPSWVCGGIEATLLAQPDTTFLFKTAAALFAVAAAVAIHRPAHATQPDLPAQLVSVYEHPIPVPVDYNAPSAPIRSVRDEPEFRESRLNKRFPAVQAAATTPPLIKILAAEARPEEYPSQLFRQSPNQPTQPYQLNRPTIQNLLDVPQSLFSIFSHQVLPVPPSRPLWTIQAQTAQDLEWAAPSYGQKATQFPLQATPALRATQILPFELPVEGSAQVHPTFPGNFPQLQSVPTHQTQVLEFVLPEQFGSTFIPTSAFIPSVDAPPAGGVGGGGRPKRRYQIKLGERILEGSQEQIEALAREIALSEPATPDVVEIVVPAKKRKPALIAKTQVAADVLAAFTKAVADEQMRLQEIEDEEALIALLT